MPELPFEENDSVRRRHPQQHPLSRPTSKFVFSIPIMLRVYFKYDRKLLRQLCHCAKESLEVFFRTLIGLQDGILGMIMVIHTFGDYARFHPHLHAIVADGLFRPDGTFHCLPKRESNELEEIFRAQVLTMLKNEGKINQELIEKLMNWRHSGFSVHVGNRIAADDQDGQRALAEYILRNAFSEQEITYLEDTGKVLYRSAMTHGSNKKNFEIFTAEEFMAAITQHIPDKHFQMVRYYGWDSNRSRGERNKADFRADDQPRSSTGSPDVTVLDVSDYKPRRIPSKTWRELIKKIWEVDPLSCPRCHHEMKIISLINEPDVIERILRYLGLWKQQTAPSRRKARAPEHGPVVIADFDDAWPGYEEPVIVYHQASALETVPTSPYRSSLPACLPGPPDPGARADTLHTKKLSSGTTCLNLAPDSLYDGDIPSKIETKMCLTYLTTPATQKPSESNFLSPYHLTSPHLITFCVEFF